MGARPLAGRARAELVAAGVRSGRAAEMAELHVMSWNLRTFGWSDAPETDDLDRIADIILHSLRGSRSRPTHPTCDDRHNQWTRHDRRRWRCVCSA